MAVGVTIKTRRGTAAEWAAANPVLAAGEQGFETDSRLLKFGDGVTAYNSLRYSSGSRSATFVIAASDSSAKEKAQADYVCDGTDDNVEIQAALDALPSTGGEIKLLSGSFQLAAIISRTIDNVTITGSGYNTYVKYNAGLFNFSIGTQAFWTFQNLRVDYGGIELVNGTKWLLSNVWRDNWDTSAILIDNWSADHIAKKSTGSFLSRALNHPLVDVLTDVKDGEWTAAGCDLTYDTTIKHMGVCSAKIVTTSTEGKIDRAVTFPDLTNSAIGVWIYTPDASKIQLFKLYIRTSVETWTHYAYASKTYSHTINDHWHFVVFDHFPLIIGTPDLSQVNAIRFSVVPQSGQVATVYVDSFYYFKKTLTPSGAITFTFDDGLDNVISLGKPLFDALNYKATFSLVVGRVTSASMANAKYAQLCGWDIVNHSLDHSDTRSLADPLLNYALTQKWFSDNGFKTGAEFAYLNSGAHNAKMIDFLENNYQIARSSISGYNCLPLIGTLALTQIVLNSTPIATITGWIDTAIANGLWLTLQLHNITESATGTYEISTANLQTILEYCNSSGIEVLTLSEIMDRINNKIVSVNGTGTISNGTTSINIRHGFHKVPSSIQISPTSSLGSAASIWVSSKDVGSTGNLFTVSVNADPEADVTFDWKAIL